MRYLVLLVIVVIPHAPVAAQPAKLSPAVAKKLAEGTPPPLPQSPKDGRLRSDAQDVGLKGRVKSVTYRQTNNSDPRSPKKMLTREEFHGEDGNRTRTVAWDELHPVSVTVFGYIDGMRVSRYGSIDHPDGEKPHGRSCVPLVHTLPDSKENSTPKGDPRYNLRWDHKYDSLGRLLEEREIGNAGQVLARTVYQYEPGNRRRLLQYLGGTEPIAKTLEIISPTTGDLIEEWLFDEDDKVSVIRLFTHESDAQGNWIVQTVREKDPWPDAKPKIASTIYRKIAYFQ